MTDPISFFTTDSISANAEGWEVRNAILGFYWSKVTNWMSWVDVVKTMYDSSGAETTSSSGAVSSLYTVTLRKQIEGVSTSSISVGKLADKKLGTEATEATITVTPPT
jgi:hypothetical protein